MENRPTGSGKSSFDLIDQERLWAGIRLDPESTVADLGCGAGNYSLALSRRLAGGTLYAVDLWREGIDRLQETLESRSIPNVKPIAADVSVRIPVPDLCLDVCFMATVFHDLVRDGVHEGALREVKRALKRRGRFVIVEFKKIDGPPGPPVASRLSLEQLEEILVANGFRAMCNESLGPYCYLAEFIMDLQA